MRDSSYGFSFALVPNFLALFVLFAITFFSPFLTVAYNSVQTNFIIALFQIVFFVLMFRSTIKEVSVIFLDKKNLLTSFFVFSFTGLILVSLWLSGGSVRSFVYVANVLFFLSLISLFAESRVRFDFFLKVKIFSIFLVCLVFLGVRISKGEAVYGYIFIDPEIYRHLRHFNYDLMIAMGALFLLLATGRMSLFWYVSLFFVFSFFLMWTGGRGQFVALLIFLFFIFYSRLRVYSVLAITVLIFSFLLVTLLGETNFLFGQIERTFDSSNLDGVSSGRLEIWSSAWSEAMTGGLFGHGADSFRGFDSTGIVQPHNSIVQFMFEFGFVGLTLCVLFFLSTGLLCIRLIMGENTSTELKVLSSFVLAMYAYSLVDGIFYHAIPFSFMVIIGAMFFVELKDKGGHRANSSAV